MSKVPQNPKTPKPQNPVRGDSTRLSKRFIFENKRDLTTDLAGEHYIQDYVGYNLAVGGAFS